MPTMPPWPCHANHKECGQQHETAATTQEMTTTHDRTTPQDRQHHTTGQHHNTWPEDRALCLRTSAALTPWLQETAAYTDSNTGMPVHAHHWRGCAHARTYTPPPPPPPPPLPHLCTGSVQPLGRRGHAGCRAGQARGVSQLLSRLQLLRLLHRLLRVRNLLGLRLRLRLGAGVRGNHILGVGHGGCSAGG